MWFQDSDSAATEYQKMPGIWWRDGTVNSPQECKILSQKSPRRPYTQLFPAYKWKMKKQSLCKESKISLGVYNFNIIKRFGSIIYHFSNGLTIKLFFKFPLYKTEHSLIHQRSQAHQVHCMLPCHSTFFICGPWQAIKWSVIEYFLRSAKPRNATSKQQKLTMAGIPF